MRSAAHKILVIILFLLGDFPLLCQSCSSPSESAYNYCGTPGSTIPGGWFQPDCRNGNCGLETWYVKNLPNGVTASINPATTTVAQATVISVTVADSVTPGLYTFQVGATCSPQACGVATAKVFVAPPPKIYYIGPDGALQDVTDSSTPVAVGQQVQLSAVTYPSDAVITSQQWSVPGTLIKSYGTNTAAGLSFDRRCANGDCLTVSVAQSDLMDDLATFHWVDNTTGCESQDTDGCVRVVMYSATLSGGQTVSAKTKFSIQSPSASDPAKPLLSATIDTAHVVLDDKSIFGPARLELVQVWAGIFASGAGFIATPNLSSPQSFPGTTYLLQLGRSRSEQTRKPTPESPNGRVTICENPPDQLLYDKLYTTSEEDSPGSALPGKLSALRLSDTFRVYLMWESNLPNSVPVPLGSLGWDFTGKAEFSSSIFKVLFPWSIVPGSTQQHVMPFVLDSSFPPPWQYDLAVLTPPSYNCYHY